LPGADDALAAFPNLERWFHAIDRRPAAARARAVGKDRAFKQEIDEEARRALYPSNYPPTPNRASAHGGDRGKQETTSS
jgi:GST-like protein